MRKRAMAAIGLLAVGAVLAGCFGYVRGQHPNPGPDLDVDRVIVNRSSSTEASPSQISASQSPSPAGPSVTSGTDSGLSSRSRQIVQRSSRSGSNPGTSTSRSPRTPAADREALAATVAVDPTKANMLSDAAKFDSQGLETYGSLAIGSPGRSPSTAATTAVIDDCQDAQPERVDRRPRTGDKVTVGVARDHYQGSLVKGDDGVWRVEQVFYLKDEPC